MLALGIQHQWEIAIRLLDYTPAHWYLVRSGRAPLLPTTRRLLQFAISHPRLTRRELLGPLGVSPWERKFRKRPYTGPRPSTLRRRAEAAEKRALLLTREQRVARLDALLARDGF